MDTTVQSATSMSGNGAPSSRSLGTSFGLHVLVLVLLLLVPMGPIRQGVHPDEVDVVFHRPPPRLEVPVPTVLPPSQGAANLARVRPARPAPPASPATRPDPGPSAPGDPLAVEPPGLTEAPEVAVTEVPPPPKVKPGILAFRDQLTSLAQDRGAPRLGVNARYSAADDVGQASSRALLSNNAPGSSGGIDVDSLMRNVKGGGRGNGDALQGVQVGRATSSIAGIGGGDSDRPLAGEDGGRGGAALSRTDEEIQIVFDRHKASFYRLYNRELRKDPTLRGQMVLRLTIEPDGSVSMCALQSSDMNAPDLAAQVVARVREINFGAKDVAALTIVYPIDFLPAA